MSKQKRKKRLMQEQARIVESQQALLKQTVNLVNDQEQLPPIVRENPDGLRKMSEIILEFAKPLLDNSDDKKTSRTAITVAVMAWNLALYNPLQRMRELKALLKTARNSSDREFDRGFEPIIKSLINRKLALYPEVMRLVINFDVVDTVDGIHLNVISTVVGNDRSVVSEGVPAANHMHQPHRDPS